MRRGEGVRVAKGQGARGKGQGARGKGQGARGKAGQGRGKEREGAYNIIYNHVKGIISFEGR